MTERTLTATARTLPPNHMLGLRTNWLTGTDDKGVTFDLDSGAGVGSPALSLTLKLNGEIIATEVIDMREFVQHWVKDVLETHPDTLAAPTTETEPVQAEPYASDEPVEGGYR